MDACIEHLGGLPDQLNLTNDQVTALLAYHRIKRRSQNVCRECSEKSQTAEKVCFICQRTYTEKYGPRGSSGEKDEGLLEVMRAMARQGQKPEKLVKDATDEEREAFSRAVMEKWKKAGVKIRDE